MIVVPLPSAGRWPALQCCARLVLLLCAAPATATAFADPSPLTLEHARRLAAQRAPALQANRHEAQAAREMAVAAGRRPDPVLKLGINNLPIEGPDRWRLNRDFMTMTSIGVMQELPGQAKRDARSARSLREAQLAEAMAVSQAQQAEREAALAWIDRSLQESALELLQRQLADARLLEPSAEAAYRAGRGPQSAVFAARAAVEQLEERRAMVEQELAVAMTRLQRWLGDDALQPLASRPELRKATADVHEAVDAHPELDVARAREALAAAEAELARTEREPDWSVELMYAKRGSAFGDMVSVNFSVPLPWDRPQRQDRELAARLAMRDAAREQLEEQRRMHLAEAQSLHHAWRSQLARLARYDATLLPLAQRRSESTLAAYRGGSAALADVLEARRMALDLEMERLALEGEAARSWAQLQTLKPLPVPATGGNAHGGAR